MTLDNGTGGQVDNHFAFFFQNAIDLGATLNKEGGIEPIHESIAGR